MTVRRAGVGDAHAMAEVELGTALVAYKDFFPPEAPAPRLERLVQRWEDRIAAADASDDDAGRTAVFCAVDDTGRIVGTACGQPDPDDAARGYLASLYVLPERWGRGTGRHLHDEVVDHFAAVGFATATLWVIEQNERTRTMYERWGWEPTSARREAFAGSGVEEIRYVRTVTGTSQQALA